LISDVRKRANVAYFFLGCVMVAGIYGAITAQRSILFVQIVPATIAVIFVWLAQQA